MTGNGRPRQIYLSSRGRRRRAAGVAWVVGTVAVAGVAWAVLSISGLL